MNNKPVAWMHKDDRDTFFSAIDHSESNKWIPLYTHPVKDLTDEEIQLLMNDVPEYDISNYDLFEFAKAILRKAQV